jgi:hypothetical protein
VIPVLWKKTLHHSTGWWENMKNHQGLSEVECLAL